MVSLVDIVVLTPTIIKADFKKKSAYSFDVTVRILSR